MLKRKNYLNPALGKNEATRFDAEIARINELSKTARTSWFSLLAYLAFVGVTLLGVEDADFFIPSRQTALPLIGVQIPTASFFIFAPILGAALYIYLHLHLAKLWEAMGEARGKFGGEALRPKLYPWLVNDLALTYPGKNPALRKPLTWLSNATTRLLVWIAGPLVLLGFWWRSHPAHNEWLTLGITVCLALALYTGFASWWGFGGCLRGDGGERQWGRWFRWIPGLTALIAVVAVSWLRTEGSFTQYVENPPFDLPNDFLAPTNLNGVAFVAIPPEWRNKDTHRRRFRAEWCSREALSADICGRVPSPATPVPTHVRAAREIWCSGKYEGEGCTAHFAERDTQFEAEWDEERSSLNALLGGSIDLAGRDLRGAEMIDAFLPGARLNGARLEGAILSGARLEGANLRRARLEGANLSAARLEGANLNEARLEGANLFAARLEGADLIRARLEGADLRLARLEGANLRLARLEEANLRRARLEGADLIEARLEGAVLIEARLEGADLRLARLEGANLRLARLEEADLRLARLEGAVLIRARFQSASWAAPTVEHSPAHEADFRDANALSQAQLERVIGNSKTLLPDGLSDAGEPFYVWSCWETPPEGYEEMVERFWPQQKMEIAEALLCQHRERVKTGTPMALD